MLKKLLTIVISAVMFVTVLGGCTLVALDNNKDMSQAVAVVAARTITYKQDGVTKSYTYGERVITKAQLVNAYDSQAQSYYQQNNGASILNAGYTPAELMDNLLENLIERQLFLREAEFLLYKGDIVITQKDYNTVWKSVYTNIDTYIYQQEQAIAKAFGEDIYDKGTTEDTEPTYPAREDYYTGVEDEDTADEDKWTPERGMYPNFTDDMNETQRKEAARTVQGMRRFVEYLKQILDSNKELLTPEENTKYLADLEFLKKFEQDNQTPAQYVELYPQLMNLWMIEYVFYEQSYEELLFNKFQDYFVKQAKASLEDNLQAQEAFQKKYNDMLSAQKTKFQDADAYASARGTYGTDSATEKVIVWDPVNNAQYYVKHVLVPFPEGSTNVADINVYERDIYGNDMLGKGTKTAQQVYNEIKAALSSQTTLRGIDQTFTDYIFKYNTDPGIFNNKLGYGVKDLASFVDEFKVAAAKLYDDGNGKVGSLSEMVISNYGVHIIMLSSIVEAGTKDPNDFVDATQSKTVYDVIMEDLIDTETSAAIEEFQYALRDKKNGEWKNDIVKYAKRYRSIVKILEKQVG